MSLTTVDSGLISSGAITLTTQVSGTLPEANGGTGTTVGYCGFKNRIINGGMVIDQRNAGAAFGTSVNGYTLDRWIVSQSVTGKINGGQNYNSITPLAGFTNYLGIQSQSAYSVGSSDYYRIIERIEGFNVSDLGWGTAGAQSVTLSFWVRSSLTGTFGGVISNSAANRSYPFTYTISAANTWEFKTVTIPGDTSGTWLTNNGIGIELQFGLGVGSTFSGTAGAWAGATYLSATGAVSVVGTNGATFYITGVQLEKGSTATSFDYRPYGTELALCQRYYEIGASFVDAGYVPINTPVSFAGSVFAVTKRAAPTTVFTTTFNSNGYGLTTRTNYVSGFWRFVLAAATGAVAFSETWTASAEL